MRLTGLLIGLERGLPTGGVEEQGRRRRMDKVRDEVRDPSSLCYAEAGEVCSAGIREVELADSP